MTELKIISLCIKQDSTTAYSLVDDYIKSFPFSKCFNLSSTIIKIIENSAINIEKF